MLRFLGFFLARVLLRKLDDIFGIDIAVHHFSKGESVLRIILGTYTEIFSCRTRIIFL